VLPFADIHDRRVHRHVVVIILDAFPITDTGDHEPQRPTRLMGEQHLRFGVGLFEAFDQLADDHDDTSLCALNASLIRRSASSAANDASNAI